MILVPKRDGLSKNIDFIYEKLVNDEEILRLLYYAPRGSKVLSQHTNEFTDLPSGVRLSIDPLSSLHPNILPIDTSDDNEVVDKYWEIVDQSIKTKSKDNDITNLAICRLCVYHAKSRSPYGQEESYRRDYIEIDILTEDRYEEGDTRSMAIVDRIQQLFHRKKGLGVGISIVTSPMPIQTVPQYTKYRVYVEVTNVLL